MKSYKMNKQEVSNMLLQQLPIPKELFEHSEEYCFPSLIIDNNGIFTGECVDFYNYNIFPVFIYFLSMDFIISNNFSISFISLLLLYNKSIFFIVDLRKSLFVNKHLSFN